MAKHWVFGGQKGITILERLETKAFTDYLILRVYV